MKTFSNCEPLIVNKDILSTKEFEFMDRDRIKKQCKCINKSCCIQLVDLLNKNKYVEADELLDTLTKKS